MAKPIPDGFHALTPYLAVRGAAAALDFYAGAFGAEEISRMDCPDGTVGHAELRVGDSRLMVAEENAEWGSVGPQALGGSPVSLVLYVPDVDAAFARAVAAGASVRHAVKDQLWGDRTGTLDDPFGHRWVVATHVEDVTPEEMQARMAAAPAA